MSWFSHTGLGRVLKHGWKGFSFGGVSSLLTGLFDSMSAFADAASSPIENLIKGSTGEGLTDAQKEEISTETAAQNSLNEQDYYRKIDFYQRFESPEAQVAQYKNAGLNPALMYQNGANISSSGGVGAGSAGNAGASSPALLGLFGNLLNFASRQQQIKTERILGEQRNEIERYKVDKQAEYWETLGSESQSRSLLNNATRLKVEADAEARKILNWFLPKQQEATLALTQSQTEEINEKVKNHQTERLLMLKNLLKISAEIEVLNSQVDLNSAKAQEALQNIKTLKAQAYMFGQQAKLTKLEVDNFNTTHAKIITESHSVSGLWGAGSVSQSTQKVVGADGKVIDIKGYTPRRSLEDLTKSIDELTPAQVMDIYGYTD